MFAFKIEANQNIDILNSVGIEVEKNEKELQNCQEALEACPVEAIGEDGEE